MGYLTHDSDKQFYRKGYVIFVTNGHVYAKCYFPPRRTEMPASVVKWIRVTTGLYCALPVWLSGRGCPGPCVLGPVACCFRELDFSLPRPFAPGNQSSRCRTFASWNFCALELSSIYRWYWYIDPPLKRYKKSGHHSVILINLLQLILAVLKYELHLYYLCYPVFDLSKKKQCGAWAPARFFCVGAQMEAPKAKARGSRRRGG